MAIKRIGTNGYRGAPSGGQYIQPGEYEVGGKAGQIKPALAEYMLSIDLAWVVEETAPEPEQKPAPRKSSTKAQHRGNKIVELDDEQDAAAEPEESEAD